MYPGGDPFGPQSGDPFGAPGGGSGSWAQQPSGWGQPPQGGPPFGSPPRKTKTWVVAAAVIGACALLVAGGVWWVTRDKASDIASDGSTTLTSAGATEAATATVPSVVTTVITPTTTERVKLDLASTAVGTCVRVQIRSASSSDALDLYKVDCAAETGIYTVTERVAASADCHSVYVAAPEDHSFALCLDPYRG